MRYIVRREPDGTLFEFSSEEPANLIFKALKQQAEADDHDWHEWIDRKARVKCLRIIAPMDSTQYEIEITV
jgi:hypothetical protein